jgi:hypothetical protein
MRFAGLKNILKINLQLQLEACWGDVIMTSSWQLEMKMKAKTFWGRKINLSIVTMKYGCFVVLALCSKSIYLELSINTKHDFDLNKARIKPQPPKDEPWERFVRGEATHKTNRTPTENSGRFDKIKYLDDQVVIRCSWVKEPHQRSCSIKVLLIFFL